jgi:hypothetical protein
VGSGAAAAAAAEDEEGADDGADISQLSPEAILDALDALRLAGDGDVEAEVWSSLGFAEQEPPEPGGGAGDGGAAGEEGEAGGGLDAADTDEAEEDVAAERSVYADLLRQTCGGRHTDFFDQIMDFSSLEYMVYCHAQVRARLLRLRC